MRNLLLIAALLSAAGRPPEVPFRMHTLDLGANETCAFADINRDGRLDIVSGENWYAAPSWTRHKFRSLAFTNNYIDAFSDLPVDVDGDGFADIVSVTWFGRKISWWKNPGKAGGAWTETPIDTGFSVEFAFLVDADNDGRARELLPQAGDAKQPLAWYALAGGRWEKRVVSPRSHGHGIGAGDVNGDGRTDILTPKGWFEAPEWKHHPDWDESAHLGFMHVLDVNEDGRNDVLTSYAHDYGIFWLEQGVGGRWTRRVIDDSWSQAHALTLADLDGDGRKDLITGKRYMAHNGRDPGEREPLGVYWYEYRKAADGGIEWIRHVVDYGSRAGGGMQIPAADLDGDGDVDFACAGKSGLFLFENLTKKSGRR
jgi:hypothetical protein